jgi:di/tricarboxylate transporter
VSLDAWITLAVVAVTLVLLAGERVAPALAVLAADVALMALGVLPAGEALAGFSNPAPFAVAALYVVARGVEKTGALQPILHGGLSDASSTRGALARLLVPVAAASAFLNNTPIVAMVAPQVAAWAKRTGRAASRYLMPLSFAAILGGVLTAIGTSTTLVVSGLMQSHGMEPVGMFEITRLGLPVAVLGLAFLVLAAPRLLPVRSEAFEELREHAREFVVDMEVVAGGPLDGTEVGRGGLRSLEGVFLAEVRRAGESIAPARPSTRLLGGDHLVFVGRADHVLDLHTKPGLRSVHHEHAAAFHAAGHTYFEAVIGQASPLAGRTLKEVDFRRRYQAAVIAVHRAGEPVRAKLGAVTLRAGDTLLLLSDEDFRERWRDRIDFLLIAHFGGLAPTSSRQAWVVAGVLVALVGANVLGFLPILHAALLAALALVAGRVLTPAEAGRAVDLGVVVLIAGALGLGNALESTGLAATAADGIFAVFRGLGPPGVLLGIVLATLALTEFITNNAAAALVFPIAMAAAAGHGLDPRPVALAVAVAASSSFLTPIGYQTNTMVYGPGGYRFGDYARLGAPLTLLVAALITVLVPLLWDLS